MTRDTLGTLSTQARTMVRETAYNLTAIETTEERGHVFSRAVELYRDACVHLRTLDGRERADEFIASTYQPTYGPAHFTGSVEDHATIRPKGSQRGPIRKVTEHRLDGTVMLACGHVVFRRTSHDEWRRCQECPLGLSPRGSAIRKNRVGTLPSGEKSV